MELCNVLFVKRTGLARDELGIPQSKKHSYMFMQKNTVIFF